MDKGLDYVQDKIGIELKPDMTPEEVAEVRKAAMQHEEFKVSEANKNTANARDMNSKIQDSVAASWLSKNAAYVIDFSVVLATIVLSGFAYFHGVPEENKELVYMALGSMITMTGTILNFHRGSSSGSEKKTEIISRSSN
jgi:hypothetical protein